MENDNTKSTQSGGIGKVNLNSDQIDNNIASLKNSGLDVLTFGYGIAFLHETIHTATGTLLLKPGAKEAIGDPSPNQPNAIGPTVKTINSFRNELRLPERDQYFWQATSATSPRTMDWSLRGTTTTVTQGTMTGAEKTQRRRNVSFLFGLP